MGMSDDSSATGALSTAALDTPTDIPPTMTTLATGSGVLRVSASPAAMDEVLAALDEWIADESGFEEATWEELREALETDRLSARERFPA